MLLENTGHVTTPMGRMEVSGCEPFSFLKSTLQALPGVFTVPHSPKEGLQMVPQGPSVGLNCILRTSTRRLPGWRKLFHSTHPIKSLASFRVDELRLSCGRQSLPPRGRGRAPSPSPAAKNRALSITVTKTKSLN